METANFYIAWNMYAGKWELVHKLTDTRESWNDDIQRVKNRMAILESRISE